MIFWMISMSNISNICYQDKRKVQFIIKFTLYNGEGSINAMIGCNAMQC